jgi:hypothetical protein
VRERVPSPDLSPVVAIGGATECVIGDQLRTAGREVVYATRNPWFDGDVTDLSDDLVSLINTSEQAAKATVCYSSGGLFSMPGDTPASAELKPICTTAYEVRIPPFGAREFPVARDGSSHFSIETQGAAIVLEMLRPLGASIKMYTVDSTIRFGSEVPAASCQRSAFSGQLLDECGQHRLDFDGICGELFVKGCWDELKVFGEQQVVLHFARRTACEGAEAAASSLRHLSSSCRETPLFVGLTAPNRSLTVAAQ